MSTPFPVAAIAEATQWGRFFGGEWVREIPTNMHDRNGLSADGTPRWQADFARWLMDAPDEERQRTTRVMRKLRRISPRSYEVLYRAMVQGESFEEIATWLNDRAARNRIPLPDDRPVWYRVKDAVAIFLAGVSYCRHWF